MLCTNTYTVKKEHALDILEAAICQILDIVNRPIYEGLNIPLELFAHVVWWF